MPVSGRASGIPNQRLRVFVLFQLSTTWLNSTGKGSAPRLLTRQLCMSTYSFHWYCPRGGSSTLEQQRWKLSRPKHIPALFLIVKWICVVLRRNRSRSLGTVSGAAVCTHDCTVVLSVAWVMNDHPFTVLFSHVLETWKSRNIHNLWLFPNVLERFNWNLDMEWKENWMKNRKINRAYNISAGPKKSLLTNFRQGKSMLCFPM